MIRGASRVALGGGLAFFMVEDAGVGWSSPSGLAVIGGGALFGLVWHGLKAIEAAPDDGRDHDDGDDAGGDPG